MAWSRFTRARLLVNPEDRKGYRLPAWCRRVPNLFEADEDAKSGWTGV